MAQTSSVTMPSVVFVYTLNDQLDKTETGTEQCVLGFRLRILSGGKKVAS